MAGFPPGQTDREAELLKKVLLNQIRGGQRDWVLLNAALLLYAAGKAASIAAGAKLAQQTLESGAAAKKLTELVTGVPVA
jgi:anthranilate phosphoribosyltransferase